MTSTLQPILALIVLSLSLSTIHALFGRDIAHSLEQAALFELARDSLVHAILDGIDVLVSGDFGFVKFVLYDITCLVVAEPTEDVVFDPRHPGLVLTVVPGLCGFVVARAFFVLLWFLGLRLLWGRHVVGLALS